MPWFLEGNCVRKGTKESPGATVKCHDSVEQAKAHMGALYANVEDAIIKEFGLGMSNAGDLMESKVHKAFTVCADILYGLGYMAQDERIELSGAIGDSLGSLSKAIDKLGMRNRMVSPEVANAVMGLMKGGGKPGSIFSTYKDMDTQKDRWIAVSTCEMWDRQGEMFTTQAMDNDMMRIKDSGEWPELRMFHVRAFKLGMCNQMDRIGKWAVDQGYWLDTPFAQAVKDQVIQNKGKWKVSRGFFPIRAAGKCHGCGADLTVGLFNFKLGAVCNVCKSFHPKARLGQLKYLETKTYDISVTDVPLVTSTAVAAYSVM